MKQFTGKLRLQALHLMFDAYRYRVPEAIWGEQLVYPGREYPQRNPIFAPNIRFHEVADYCLEIGDFGPDGTRLCQVFLMPNKLTSATEPLLVFDFRDTGRIPDQFLVEFALKSAFRPRD
jgi:hypothetical protein